MKVRVQAGAVVPRERVEGVAVFAGIRGTEPDLSELMPLEVDARHEGHYALHGKLIRLRRVASGPGIRLPVDPGDIGVAGDRRISADGLRELPLVLRSVSGQ